MNTYPRRILENTLQHQMFYNLYDELKNLVEFPVVKGGTSQTLIRDKDVLQDRFRIVDEMLRSFEKQVGLNGMYDAPKILATKSARSGDWSAIAQDFQGYKSMYFDYMKMKYWQEMLDRVLFEDERDKAPPMVLTSFPHDWAQQFRNIIKQASRQHLNVTTTDEVYEIDWALFWSLMENFMKANDIAVAKAPTLKIKDNPQA